MKKPQGYWDYEHCFLAAKECTCKSEFRGKYLSAYKASLKNEWILDYTWFQRPKNKNFIYTKEVCRSEALKYKTVKAFRECSPAHYDASNRLGYLDSFAGEFYQTFILFF